MTAALKPCPLCGSPAEFQPCSFFEGDQPIGPKKEGRYIGCLNPVCGCSTTFVLREQKEDDRVLAEIWNTRFAPNVDNKLVDQHLDAILRASGSALRHYTMAKSLEGMRQAVRDAMVAGVQAHEVQQAPKGGS